MDNVKVMYVQNLRRAGLAYVYQCIALTLE